MVIYWVYIYIYTYTHIYIYMYVWWWWPFFWGGFSPTFSALPFNSSCPQVAEPPAWVACRAGAGRTNGSAQGGRPGRRWSQGYSLGNGLEIWWELLGNGSFNNPDEIQGVFGMAYPMVICYVTMEDHHFSLENPVFRLGHFPVRKMLVITRGYIPLNPIKSP